MPTYSIIVPVYDRPDEMQEFLDSLLTQTYTDFEVLVLEDASPRPCDAVVQRYADRLDVRYFYRPGLDRSQRRNLGMEQARSNIFLLFDSDCVLPSTYMDSVHRAYSKAPADCFGGPDNAHPDFNRMQKAVNYSMTSFFTTGGIRGGKKPMESFTPRSFNMGITRKAFDATGGFRSMIGEDIDFSLRVRKAGLKTALYREAYVYHKRRVDLKKFYRQIRTFGKSRIVLSKTNPGSLKPVHLFPLLFVLGHIALIFAGIFVHSVFLFPIFAYILLLCTDAWLQNRSLHVGLLSVLTSYTQLTAYAIGFLNEAFTAKAYKAIGKQETIYHP